jgi:integrase
LQHLRSLFNHIRRRAGPRLPVNPFSHIPELPEELGERLGFEPAVAAELMAAIEAQPRLHLFVLHVYLCMLRPTEVRRLQLKDYDLARGVIHVPGEKSKNRQYATVTIPAVLLERLRREGFDRYPPEYHLFGALPLGTYDKRLRLVPGDAPCSINYVTLWHKQVAEDAGIALGTETLYSWKDTGAHDFMASGGTLMALCRQCRHSDPKMTMRYLKRLGLDAPAEFSHFNPMARLPQTKIPRR